MVAPKPHPMLYILLGVLGVLSLFIIAPLWSWVFAGLLLGYLGHPLFRRLLRRLPRRGVAAGLTLLVMVLIILVPLSYVGFQLVVQARALAEAFSADEARGLIETTTNLTRAWFGWPAVVQDQTATEALVEQLVPKARQVVLDWLPNAATYVGQLTVGIFIALFVGYYAIKDGKEMMVFVEEVMPLRPTTEKRLIAEARKALDAVLIGQLLTAVAQGALLGVGFWIFGVPAAVFWGFVATVLSVVPLIGPPLVWGPAALWLVATGRTGAGIGLLIWGAVLVSTMDNFLKPKLMAQQSGMHPTLALLGVLGGLISFGLVGFILGPVILALFLFTLQVYVDSRYEAMDFEESAEAGGAAPPPDGGADRDRRPTSPGP